MPYLTSQEIAHQMFHDALKQRGWFPAEIERADANTDFSHLPNDAETHEADYDPRDVNQAVKEAVERAISPFFGTVEHKGRKIRVSVPED